MYTGTITAVGVLRASRKTQQGQALTVVGGWKRGFEIGESIAIDGAGLIVVGFQGDKFQVEVSNECLDRSNFGRRKVGDRVNLERALRVGDAFGGHFVTGSVDGRALVAATEPAGDDVRYHVALPPGLLRYCIPRGSVALDGVALSIHAVNDAGGTIEVLVPAHTRRETTLGDRKVGSSVNVEVDQLARYAERLLSPRSADPEQTRTAPGRSVPTGLDPTLPPEPGSLG